MANIISMTPTTDFSIEWNQFSEIIKELTTAHHVNAIFHKSLAPYLQFVRLDALDPKDYPHHIDDNSIFLEFEVNLMTRKVELFKQGHIYLSQSDREGKYKYLAMKSMTNAHVDLGGKKFRKSKFKTMTDLANKLEAYYKDVMQSVKIYTNDCYPYKQGV